MAVMPAINCPEPKSSNQTSGDSIENTFTILPLLSGTAADLFPLATVSPSESVQKTGLPLVSNCASIKALEAGGKKLCTCSAWVALPVTEKRLCPGTVEKPKEPTCP